MRRLVRAPLLWLFLTDGAITILAGTSAEPMTAPEGRGIFAMSLTWCCAIMLAVRWVRARADRGDEG